MLNLFYTGKNGNSDAERSPGYAHQPNIPYDEAPMGHYTADSILPPYSPSPLPCNDKEHMMKYADEFISEFDFVYLLNKYEYML